MISVAIVDDEQSFLERVEQFLHKFGQEHGQEFETARFQDGLEIAENYQPRWDIIFLDIQMKHLDGLETARKIRKQDTNVILIFITTMAQYAINGYEVDAFDYVLKPLEYAQFEMRMLKAVRELEKRKARSFVYLKKYSDMVKVSTDDLLYVEVSGHTLRYVTTTETYEKRATIGEAEEELKDLPFTRCSLSYLVNLKRIDRISKDTVVIGPYQLPISRNRKKEFLQVFTDYLEAGY